MKTAISLKISTPFKHEFKGEVIYVEVPSISGVIGIMPNHMPIICALNEGSIKLKLQDGKTAEFKIKNGFLKFSKNNCFITVKGSQKLEKIA